MLETKNAFEILGLKEGADKNEIMKRYNVLLKRQRSNNLGTENKAEDEPDIKAINEAYNLLMGYDTVEIEEETYRESKLLKKIGVDEKKARNFLYYHKVHIIVSILAVVFLSLIIKDVVTKVKPNLSVAFVGDFSYINSKVLEDKIIKSISEVKAVNIDSALLNSQDAQTESLIKQKALVLMAVGDIDVYILDKDNFLKFAQQGALLALDDFPKQYSIDFGKNKKYALQDQSGKEQIYGIDISNNKFFTDLDITGKEMILAMRMNAKHHDNAISYIKLLINNQQ